MTDAADSRLRARKRKRNDHLSLARLVQTLQRIMTKYPKARRIKVSTSSVCGFTDRLTAVDYEPLMNRITLEGRCE